MKYICIIAALAAYSINTLANGQVLEALTSTVGSWEGELYYLDYQSGQRFGIPMRADTEQTPDGATLIRKLTFTDPGHLVHAVNLVTVDRETGEVVEAFFREGGAEFMRFEVGSVELTSASKWTVVYEHDGRDADRPARIRHTIRRSGDSLNSEKAVRFLDDESDEFFVRNGSELKRLTD